MGGVQSGPHSLGDVNLGRDALWVQERLRHKNSRVPRDQGSSSRHENAGGSSSSSSTSSVLREKQKLLKRTKSLAVISEENRAGNNSGGQVNYYRLGEPALSDVYRRQQLIPRAKLINRHSLKDRLSKSQQHLSGSFEIISNPNKVSRSRFTSDTYSVSDPHVSLPNFVSQNSRKIHNKNDRLNILEWPESPKRYQSVQNLENVSGLVDVVEENWPGDGNKSIDCIYTQVKRKRKEHRSLDSVLFEDDKELEYFNVLDLLPLSNVRLQFDDNRNILDKVSTRKKNRSLDSIEDKSYKLETSSAFNAGEENCEKEAVEKPRITNYDREDQEEDNFHSKYDGLDPDIAEALNESKIKEVSDSASKCLLPKNQKLVESGNSTREEIYEDHPVDEDFYSTVKKRILVLDSDEDKFRADVAIVRVTEDRCRPVEEEEDYKSIWISDSEETEEMSRRPQVMKVVDNDVTKRNRNSVIDIVDVNEAMKKATKETENRDTPKENRSNAEMKIPEEEMDVETVKTFFESKYKENTDAKAANRSEGKFERIIKETTSIFGKACNAVKGSLGFEARSESSDLGLGSESGSDTRRQSMEGIDGSEERVENVDKSSSNETENNHSTLSRSFSCVVDSSKNEIGPEFDHIRYKIMKSDLFSKNLFGSMKNDQTFDGLMQYLQEYSFHDLLVDNNVVIIEPVRAAESVDRKCSANNNSKIIGNTSSSCRIAGAIQKNSQQLNNVEKNLENLQPKSPRQTNLRRHFFYHPIRVNRELIDDELPDPDTVRNVRKMFEGTLKLKTPDATFSSNNCTRKTVSMKDLRRIDDNFDSGSDKPAGESRSSSRAKNLTRLFENNDKITDTIKDGTESPRSECSKTRTIAQAFEARSGQTSPSDSNQLSKHKGSRYLHNWDAGSVSSGVSSDYPDTDPGSNANCTSSEDEDEIQDDDEFDNRPGHFVSQDVLKKIRECGTSVTYYGGKVLNSYNSPMISPPVNSGKKIIHEIMKNNQRKTNNHHEQTVSNDYVKFRLVKSNSCDSRLELTGRLLVDDKLRVKKTSDLNEISSQVKCDLRKSPIMESLNVEISALDETMDVNLDGEIKKEPPIVIGLEPKKEEIKEPEIFRADFKLGKLEDAKCYANKFCSSAFNQWQVNDNIQDKKCKFGEIDFEEFEVLEDSLNSKK